MLKPNDPRELAVLILKRSICAVQVGACLADKWGIYVWGHNHIGFDGLGQHAEAECLRKANWRRLEGSTLYVAAVRRRNAKPINARPCSACQRLVARVGQVVWRGSDGSWHLL